MSCTHKSQSGLCHECYTAELKADNARLREALHDLYRDEKLDDDDPRLAKSREKAQQALSGEK